jgi:hypothetical protein
LGNPPPVRRVRTVHRRFGFEWTAGSVLCPAWSIRVLAILCLAIPSTSLVRGPLRRWHRRRKSLCVCCGYDLTGNVTGVCSECGGAV